MNLCGIKRGGKMAEILRMKRVKFWCDLSEKLVPPVRLLKRY